MRQAKRRAEEITATLDAKKGPPGRGRGGSGELQAAKARLADVRAQLQKLAVSWDELLHSCCRRSGAQLSQILATPPPPPAQGKRAQAQAQLDAAADARSRAKASVKELSSGTRFTRGEVDAGLLRCLRRVHGTQPARQPSLASHPPPSPAVSAIDEQIEELEARLAGASCDVAALDDGEAARVQRQVQALKQSRA